MVPAESEASALADAPVPDAIPITALAVPVQLIRRRIQLIPIAIAIVAVLAGSALFLPANAIGPQSAAERGTPIRESEAFQPFWDAYHTINERYAGGPVDRRALISGAISGMIGALGDPYSSYLTSDQYRESLQSISGQFEGIGAEIASEG